MYPLDVVISFMAPLVQARSNRALITPHLPDDCPLTGKTSLIFAVASHFERSICVLNLSSKALNDDNLVSLLVQAPANSILVFEDVDSAFNLETKNTEEGSEGRVTFSGLLQALDGLQAQEGHIVFLTSNHPDRLSPALLRPGTKSKQWPATLQR